MEKRKIRQERWIEKYLPQKEQDRNWFIVFMNILFSLSTLFLFVVFVISIFEGSKYSIINLLILLVLFYIAYKSFLYALALYIYLKKKPIGR